MRVCLIVFFFATMQVTSVFCQEQRSLNKENYWHDGSIMLTDGTELSGRLQHNERLGILRFEGDDGERTFTPKNVTAFEFFDVTIDRQRIFYSLKYQDSPEAMERPWFFELLQDFKTFAVISRIEPPDAKADKPRWYEGQNSKNNNPVDLFWTPEVITLVEKIFFLSGENVLEPYLKVTRRTINEMTGERNKTANRVLDKKLLLKFFTEDEVEKMKKYADENNLDTETKEDFVKMLEFANTLRKK